MIKFKTIYTTFRIFAMYYNIISGTTTETTSGIPTSTPTMTIADTTAQFFGNVFIKIIVQTFDQ